MKKYIKLIVYIFITLSIIQINIVKSKAETNKFESKLIDVTDLSTDIQSVDSDFEFNSFYIKFSTLDKIDTINFEYSYSPNNKEWSPWQKSEIHNELLDGSTEITESRSDDSDIGIVSEQIDPSKPSKYLKIKLENKSKVSKYSVFLINDGIENISLAVSSNSNYDFNYLNGIKVISRDEWGCPDQDPNSPYYCHGPAWLPEYYPTSHIIIHHTVTQNNSNDWKREVRNIWYQHSHVRDADPDDGIQGWTDIGYNFLIDPNGEIYEGRYGGEGVTAGHAFNHNSGTIGISLLGTYTDEDITQSMRQSLEKLVSTLSSRYQFSPHEVAKDIRGTENPRVSGHRDWESTGCPGNVFYPTIQNVKDSTEYYSKAYSSARQAIDLCPEGYTSLNNQCHKYAVNKDWSDTGDTPVALTKDIEGNIYTANFDTGQVSKITEDGSHEILSKSGKKPRGIVSDILGNLFVANYEDRTISRIDKNGKSSIVGKTSGKPFALTIDNFNNIYSVNIDTGSVTRMTLWGEKEDFETTGYNPTSIVSTTDGTVFVSNYLSNSITSIDRNKKITDIRVKGQNPMDLAIDKNDNIYIANYGTHTIDKLTSDGKIVELATVSKNPIAISVDENGYIYAVHENSNNISKISPTGEVDVIAIGEQSKDIFAKDNKIYTANYNSDSISELKITASQKNSSLQLTQPVYRFWSNDNQAHFYTSNRSEMTHIINNYPSNIWAYEGPEFYSFSKQSDKNLRPVYRFWSPVRQKHFYTINEAEKNSIIKNDNSWSFEGISYYTYPTKQTDTRPVYRFWSAVKQSHFFTINPAEKDYIIKNDSSWKFEGEAFYTYK